MSQDVAQQWWTEQTSAQRLSNQPILRVQTLAHELKADLNLLTLFCGKKRETGKVESVYFVGYDAALNSSSDEDNEPLFNILLLNTFQFVQGATPRDDENLWRWLSECATPRKESGKQRLKVIFNAAKEKEKNQSQERHHSEYWDRQYARFENAVDSGNAKLAHQLLIKAICAVSYSGLIPALWHKLLFGGQEKNSHPEAYWFHYDPSTPKEDENSQGELKTWEANEFLKRPETEEVKNSVRTISFPWLRTDRKEQEEDFSKELVKVFTHFAEPFALGLTSKWKPGDEFPYEENRIPFKGYALPVYDFSGTSKDSHHGNLMGWLAIITHPRPDTIHSGRENEDFEPPSENDPSTLGIRILARNFARKVREYQALSVMDRDWGNIRTPAEFTLQNFHYCSGWAGITSDGLPEEVLPKLQKIRDRTRDDCFTFLKSDGSLVLEETSSDKIEFLAVNASGRLFSPTPTTEPHEPLIFRKSPQTRIPEDSKSRLDYGLWLTRVARQIFEGAESKKSEQAVGRAEAQAQGYDKSAHQLRKLTRSIRNSTSKQQLDAIRHYFNVTFLSPKNIDSLTAFYSDVGGNFYGRDFMAGDSIEELLRSSSDYAFRLLPSLLQTHNQASAPPILQPPSVVFKMIPSDRAIWSHAHLLKQAENSIIPYEELIVDKTKTKTFYFCALVALWLNTFEHSESSDFISVVWDISKEVLTLTNSSNTKPSETTIRSQSAGTLATLQYYIANMPGNERHNNGIARIKFPPTYTDGLFTTQLPTPREDLFYA